MSCENRAKLNRFKTMDREKIKKAKDKFKAGVIVLKRLPKESPKYIIGNRVLFAYNHTSDKPIAATGSITEISINETRDSYDYKIDSSTFNREVIVPQCAILNKCDMLNMGFITHHIEVSGALNGSQGTRYFKET